MFFNVNYLADRKHEPTFIFVWSQPVGANAPWENQPTWIGAGCFVFVASFRGSAQVDCRSCFCAPSSCAKALLLFHSSAADGKLVRLGRCVAFGGRIPGVDPLFATLRNTSSVHPGAGKHPTVAVAVGGFWLVSFACHAANGSCHGAALVCALRFQAAAIRWPHSSRTVVARAYPSTSGTPCFDQVYKRQAPPRSWGSSVRGRLISAERVATAFPGHVFCAAVEFLQEHGTAFHLHRVKARRYTDCHGYIEGMLIEVTSLYCVIGGFEVLMRTSAAHEFDPAKSQSSSSDSDSWGPSCIYIDSLFAGR